MSGLTLTHSHSERPKQAWRFWKYFTCKGIFWEIFEGEMFIISQTTTLLKIFCELSHYSRVIYKSMREADDPFRRNSGGSVVKVKGEGASWERGTHTGIALLPCPSPHNATETTTETPHPPPFLLYI